MRGQHSLSEVEWSDDVSFPDVPGIPTGYRGRTLPVTRKGYDFYVGSNPLEGPARDAAQGQYEQFCGLGLLFGSVFGF